MPPAARILPWMFIAFALLGLVLGIREWLHPPFTDEQIRASLKDTWEVAASTVPVFAFSFLGLGVGEPTPSWGTLLANLQNYHVLVSCWWMYLPAILLVPIFFGFAKSSVPGQKRFQFREEIV